MKNRLENKKKATIIGIMATYSGNVVPNAVTVTR